MLKLPRILFLSLFFLLYHTLLAQKPNKPNVAEIQLMLQKLNVLGSVLYVAAHPDDENTRVIAYLSKEKKFNTAYLSATRGDGGQNLIGSDIRELLGVIRTQELLAARRVDGGQQYFSRANDFGYSKNSKETFEIWDKEAVLSDFVRVIRQHKPDVIITRFSSDGNGGHGHHTASAILADEAFDLASDRKKYPKSAQLYGVWQPKKLVFNTHPWFYKRAGTTMDTASVMALDVGVYNPLLGQSYPEIASLSRSMHKSQGFGSTGTRGEHIAYFEHKKGAKTTTLFAGINTTWTRVKRSEKVQYHINNALMNFDINHPSMIIPDLAQAYAQLSRLRNSYWKKVKLEELKQVIKACAGLYLEIKAKQYAYTPGDSIQLSIEAINRSDIEMQLASMKIGQLPIFIIRQDLYNNRSFNMDLTYYLDATVSYTDPYWLQEKGTNGMYLVHNTRLIGTPENTPALSARIVIEINKIFIDFDLPIIYKENDPVRGESYRPLEVTPPVFLNIAETAYVFGNKSTKIVAVKVTAGKSKIAGEVALNVPSEWLVSPASYPFQFLKKGEESTYRFELTPPTTPHSGEMGAYATIDSVRYQQSLVRLDYDHIPMQTLFPLAQAKIVKIELVKKGTEIGYINGSGDEIPASLTQIGYHVTMLSDDDLSADKLKKFDAVIVGIRAYNTNNRLKFQQNELMNYVKNGGTMIVQYNTVHRLVTDELGPYPFQLSKDRITVEQAEMRMLKPYHKVLNSPNKITAADFENWVQERGLYFPNEWDDKYEAILSSNDPDESARDGGLIIAPYGEGQYIYTGYSWFRQLPAGVPGAYRIFTNMISIGKE